MAGDSVPIFIVGLIYSWNMSMEQRLWMQGGSWPFCGSADAAMECWQEWVCR